MRRVQEDASATLHELNVLMADARHQLDARASLVEAMAGTGDSAVAAAMTTAVENLAGHVARIDYEPSSPGKRQ